MTSALDVARFAGRVVPRPWCHPVIPAGMRLAAQAVIPSLIWKWNSNERGPTVKINCYSFLLLFVIVTAAAGQPQAPTSAPTFDERVDVRLINLEVVVTDRGDERVVGLEADDFVLEVDGKRTDIEFFTEVRDGRAVVPSQRFGVEQTPRPTFRPTGRVPTHYLVFIDNEFTRIERDRRRVLERLEAQLENLGASDRVAVVTFDGRRLQLLSDWTASRQSLRKALAMASGERPEGSTLWSELDAQDRLMENAVAAEEQRSTLLGRRQGQAWTPSVCEAIRRLETRIDTLVHGVSAALRGMPPPPDGRKVALLLSGGWPLSAKSYLLGEDPLNQQACQGRGAELYRPLWQTANLSGYTLYPVDVPRPEGPEADRSGNSMRQLIRLDLVHGTLLRLAKETGGRAFLDGAQNHALEETFRDTRSYYSLAFTPKWRGNDREHRLEVVVKDRDLEVRHRRNYEDVSEENRISFLTEGAALLGALPDAHPLDVVVGDVPSGRGTANVPLELIVPLDPLTFVPFRRGFKAELQLRIVAVDERGQRNELSVIPVELSGEEAPAPGSHAVYEATIRLFKKPQDLWVSLYQPLTQTLYAGQARVEPLP